jgi:hypothetical protein
MIRFNTLKQKWGFDVEAANYQNQANAARASAKNAKRAGTIGAVGSILGTGLNIWASSPINATAAGNTITIGKAPYVPPDSVVSGDMSFSPLAYAQRLAKRTPIWQ